MLHVLLTLGGASISDVLFLSYNVTGLLCPLTYTANLHGNEPIARAEGSHATSTGIYCTPERLAHATHRMRNATLPASTQPTITANTTKPAFCSALYSHSNTHAPCNIRVIYCAHTCWRHSLQFAVGVLSTISCQEIPLSVTDGKFVVPDAYASGIV